MEKRGDTRGISNTHVPLLTTLYRGANLHEKDYIYKCEQNFFNK